MVCEKDIEYQWIKCAGAKNLLKKILVKDPEKRATLEDILNDEWVTDNGNEKIELDQAEIELQDNTGKKGFGNLKRLLKSKAMG